ncbi:MAG: DUF1194 domain-containing protein [Pseudomonadota bacterium]
MRIFTLWLAILSTLAGPAVAQAPTPASADIEVDLELVLAVDVSLSMTQREIEIQRRGYAEAIVSDDVLQAIRFGGPHSQIALTYIEWAGPSSQRLIVDWTLVRSREDAEAFAAKLTARIEYPLPRTSISGIIDHTMPRFENNGFTAERQVIDVSGDGPNNGGRPVLAARADAAARGITINGLPLMTREGRYTQFDLEDLDAYYEHCVITGPTAFVIPVLRWEDFPDAVRRKLILELSDRRPAGATLQRVDGYDCLIGEKIWNRYYGDWN